MTKTEIKAAHYRLGRAYRPTQCGICKTNIPVDGLYRVTHVGPAHESCLADVSLADLRAHGGPKLTLGEHLGYESWEA